MIRSFSIRSLLMTTFAFALLFAVPRVLGETAAPLWALLWIITLHQIALAAMFSTLVWLMTGKHRGVAIACIAIVLILWGPNLAGATEWAIHGEATTVIRVADAMGVTQYLGSFYTWTYDLIGYKLTVAQSS